MSLKEDVKELEEQYFNKLEEIPFIELMKGFKKELILLVLHRYRGNIQQSAKFLNMKRTTLTLMLQQFNIFKYVQSFREQNRVKPKVALEEKKSTGVQKMRRCRACKKVNRIFASDSCPSCGAPRQYIRPLSQTERKYRGV